MLATSLEKLEHRLHMNRISQDRSITNPDYPNKDESEWCASRLLCKLILKAELNPSHLAIQNAKNIVADIVSTIPDSFTETADVLYKQLLQKGFIREIMGVVHLPGLVRSYFLNMNRREVKLTFSDEEADILSALNYYGYSDSWFPVLNRKDVDEITNNHRGVFELTPTTQELEKICLDSDVVNTQGNNMLLLQLRLAVAELGGTTVAVAAAMFWEEIRKSDIKLSSRQKLMKWYQHIQTTREYLEAPKYMTKESLEEFLDASFEIVTTDPDVNCTIEEEKHKISFEHRYLFQLSENEYLIDDVSLYSKAVSWDNTLDRDQALDRLLVQSSREPLLDLIYCIVRYEHPSRVRGLTHYDRVFRLLLKTDECPFLSYSLPSILTGQRAEILPSFLLHSETCSFGAELLSEVNIDTHLFQMESFIEKEKSAIKVRTDLWNEAMGILSKGLSRFDSKAVARILLEITHSIARRIEPLLCDNRQGSSSKLEHEQTRLRTVIAIIMSDIVQRNGSETKSVLNDLTDFISAIWPEHSNQDFRAFPIVPFIQVFGLIDWIAHSGFSEIEVINSFSINAYNQVLDEFNAELRRAVCGSADGMKPVSWYGDASDISSLQWDALAYMLAKNNSLHRILHPIDFRECIVNSYKTISSAINSSSGYHPILKISWVNRLRLQLHILLQIYASVVNHYLRQGRVSPDWGHNRDAVKTNVESAILGLLKGFNMQELTVLIEPLDDSDEFPMYEYQFVTMSTEIIEAIDSFSAAGRMQFSDTYLSNTRSILFLHTVVDHSSDPNLVTTAMELIKERLGKDAWLDGSLISRIMTTAELGVLAEVKDIVPRLVEKWDSRIFEGTPARKHWLLGLARLRIIEAYLNENAEYLSQDYENILELEPGMTITIEQSEKIQRTLRFYRALAEMDTDPFAASRKFNTLLEKMPGSPSLIVNAFAAELKAEETRVGKNGSDSTEGFQRILQKWESIASELPKELIKQLGNKFQYNRLLAMHRGHEDNQFDSNLSVLDEGYRYSKEIFNLVLRNLQRRELRQDGFISEAKQYFLAYGKIPEYIENYQSEQPNHTQGFNIQHDEYNPALMRNIFNELLHCSPSKAVQVVAEEEYNTVERYLLKCHIDIAREILERVGTVRFLNDENKYNDVFSSILRNRLCFLNWSVGDQSRGGLSATGEMSSHGGVGERDWIVKDNEGNTILIAEALRLSSSDYKEKLKTHVKKTTRYDQIGLEYFFIVAYYEGDDFDEFVKQYKKHMGTIEITIGKLDYVETMEKESQRFLKVLKFIYESDGNCRSDYHIILRFPLKVQ